MQMPQTTATTLTGRPQRPRREQLAVLGELRVDRARPTVQPADQQRHGDHQVGDVEQHDADAGQCEEDRALPTLTASSATVSTPTTTAGRSGVPVRSIDRGQRLRRTAAPGRAPSRRSSGWSQSGSPACRRSGDRDVDQEDPAEGVAEPAGQHVRQALGRVAEAAVGDAGRSHQGGEQHERRRRCRTRPGPAGWCAVRCGAGCLVSSESSPALSKPTRTYAAISAEMMNDHR